MLQNSRFAQPLRGAQLGRFKLDELGYEYDEREWPFLLIVEPQKVPSDAVFRAHLQTVKRYYERGERFGSRRFCGWAKTNSRRPTFSRPSMKRRFGCAED
ncbi:MAG: hypothetical protein ABW061_19520 [Polyangiaceae bacterium]